ncbi:FMN-dependent NADH-azoreductase [Pilimelia anulata]|uniref:FMN dependent NADH:quinone oxidoreductase n=1 Tax=Pilimelia anulata TaxID=53371 RepID=A0A8J3FA60_9ACTN|nr:NAD(P)H-dependent oxidoreductase [Pilimelia anulata]GGJ96459.1 FMN-dependent NADH-azoreductase [Pilimelia anulata]
MNRLLHIDCSPSPQSVSRSLAGIFRTALADELPDLAVAHRDLVRTPVPHPDPAAVHTLIAEPADAAGRAAAALHDELAAELLAADALLISAPMHNWTIPSNLKAWLDQALVPNRTLPYAPGTSALADRPATVLLAYGGDYGAGSADADMDHCAPYLRTVLGRVLGYDLEIITAAHTVAPYLSRDPAELARSASARGAAEAAAARRARAVARGTVAAR